jgi:hypothetical protein
LILTFNVVELGSGVQISHLARAGVEVTELPAQPSLPTLTGLSAAKSEVCTPDPEKAEKISTPEGRYLTYLAIGCVAPSGLEKLIAFVQF